MTNTLDIITVDILTVRLETDYLRFDADSWYRYNKVSDSYERVANAELIEDIYISTKEQNS